MKASQEYVVMPTNSRLITIEGELYSQSLEVLPCRILSSRNSIWAMLYITLYAYSLFAFWIRNLIIHYSVCIMREELHILN
jgi:hypothetical protein